MKNVHVFVPVCFSLCCYYAHFSDYGKPGQAYPQEMSREFTREAAQVAQAHYESPEQHYPTL